MRLIFAATPLLAIVFLAPLSAGAESHEGVVHQLHIDSNADTPLCAATIPSMPGGAWACIYPSRPYYQEMKEMLFRALDAGHRCAFEWTQRDAVTNRAQIIRVTCSGRQQ